MTSGEGPEAVGRTRGQAPEVDGVVHIEGLLPDGVRVGDVIKVTIDAAMGYDFVGTCDRRWKRTRMTLNVPNSITFFRVVLVPVLMAFLLVDVRYGDVFALVVFVLAAASDSLDGYLARRFRQTTALGAFLDPLADKLLVAAALVSLIELNELSAWVAMVVHSP